MFVDCVHSQRKTLRQQLVKIKLSKKQQEGNEGNNQSLLETYLRIVKTGASDEIEQFS